MTITEKIENSLTKDIKKGFYKPNQKLPSIKELCILFGASDISIRNALKNLKNQDIIYAKRGSGIYIKEKRQHKKSTIAILFPEMNLLEENEIHNLHFNILDELIVRHNKNEKYGFNLLISFEGFTPETLSRQNIDGAIFIGSYPEAKLVEHLKEIELPHVFAGKTSGYDNLNYVDYDYKAMLHEALERLLKEGHKKILFAQRTPINQKNSEELEEYFFKYLYKKGLAISQSKVLPLNSNFLEEDEWKSVITDYSAIYCQGPYEANAIYKTLIQKGLAPSKDFSMIASSFTENLYKNEHNISGFEISLDKYVESILESIKEQTSGKATIKQRLLQAKWTPGSTMQTKRKNYV